MYAKQSIIILTVAVMVRFIMELQPDHQIEFSTTVNSSCYEGG